MHSQPSAPFPQLQHNHATHNRHLNAVRLQRPIQQPQNPIEGDCSYWKLHPANPPEGDQLDGQKNALLGSFQNRTDPHEAQALLLSPEGPSKAQITTTLKCCLSTSQANPQNYRPWNCQMHPRVLRASNRGKSTSQANPQANYSAPADRPNWVTPPSTTPSKRKPHCRAAITLPR